MHHAVHAATVLFLVSLQDIQCGDNPSVFKSLQTHGDDVSAFSLRNDHTGFDDRCRSLTDMPLNGMAGLASKASWIPVDDGDKSLVERRNQPPPELFVRAKVEKDLHNASS